MTRPILYLSGMLALAFAAGCASSTSPTSTPQVNYQQGQTYLYTAQTLDAKTGQPTGTVDTITAKVIKTNASYQGMTNVTEIQNSHSDGSHLDTTYIAQNNGNYWHYNYGLESLNTNPAVLLAVGKPIEAGWVLQAKFSATPGQAWVGVDTSLSATVFGHQVNATIIDSAAKTSDTLINIAVAAPSDTAAPTMTNVSTNHVVHTVIVTGLGSGASDSYVSPQYGAMIDVVHPTELAGEATPGRITILILAPFQAP